MTLHFDPAEYTARQSQALTAVKDPGLDALLMFAPESHLWLAGYDTFGFAMFQTMVLTAQGDTHIRLHAACAEALEACEAAIKPGAPMGDVFTAHAKVFDAHGLGHARLQACGYGMGAVYNPIWVDFPMFYDGNPLIMQQGQVFFLHMILMDSDAGAAMTLGHSVLVTEHGCERLSRHPLDLLVR